jgi:hypothetical protein
MVNTTINARVGTKVRLSGLSAAPMNGRVGIIESTNHDKGRHVVNVQSIGGSEGGEKMKIRPGNLEVVALPTWPLNNETAAALQRSIQEPRCMIMRSLVAGTYEIKWRRAGEKQFQRLASLESVFSLHLDSVIQIIWRDPKAKVVSKRDLLNSGMPGPADRGQHRVAGTLEFTYLDPATLAMEFHTMTTHLSPDDYKFIDGNILYLMGEYHLFGSAVINFMAAGSVAPVIPRNSAVRAWADCASTRDLARFAAEVQEMGRQGLRNRQVPRGSNILTTTAMINGRGESEKVLPWMSYEGDFPLRGQAELPGWWKRAVGPWDSAMAIIFEGGGSSETIPCMFFASQADPKGNGCALDPGFDYSASGITPCQLRHDEEWLNRCRVVRRRTPSRMWLCGGCGEYAGDSACTSCAESSPAFLCGQCPATLGMLQCAPCVAANMQPQKKLESSVGQQQRFMSTQPQSAEQVQENAASALGMQLPRMPLGVGPNYFAAATYDQCARCGKNEGKLLKCSRCKNTVCFFLMHPPPNYCTV